MASQLTSMGVAVPFMGMVDRSVLLRYRNCHSQTHHSICTLTTWKRSESWLSSKADGRTYLKAIEPSAQRKPVERPRLFQRASRDAKVQQLRQQAAECCSLSFGLVDPYQQEGMTRRMLVFFKSLDDSSSYWEEEVQRKEQAFQLLLVPDAGMTAIRGATQTASTLLEDRRYRCAYEVLSEVRCWLPASAPKKFQAEAESILEAETPIQQPKKVGEAEKPLEEFLKLPLCFFSGALPVRNTFIHFDLQPEEQLDLYPQEPKRACSAPSALQLSNILEDTACRCSHSLERDPHAGSPPSDILASPFPNSCETHPSMKRQCETHTSSLDEGTCDNLSSSESLEEQPRRPTRQEPSSAKGLGRGRAGKAKGRKRAQDKPKTPALSANCCRPELPKAPPATGNDCYKHEWTERLEKLHSLKRLMRRFSLPCGDFQVSICPESFGHATGIIKCTSRPAPAVVLSLRVGAEARKGQHHDFSKKPTLQLQLSLHGANSEAETFTVAFTVFTFEASGSPWES